MFALLRKEISAFFSSSTGYVVITVFLIINGLFLWVFPLDFNILDYGYASIDGFFALAPWVFLFLIPAISMRTFSEEQRNGTMELLFTKPLADTEIIIAKYLSGLVLLIIALVPTLIYVFTVYQLGYPKGNLDWGGIWGSYLGLLFLGGGFLAIGVFSSSISESAVVSFLVSVLICGFVYAGFESIYSLSFFGRIDLFIRELGIQSHYSSMSRGVIDTRDVIYFLSLITLFLLATRYKLNIRKWK
jgi:ABC-2 type transport system permease protein